MQIIAFSTAYKYNYTKGDYFTHKISEIKGIHVLYRVIMHDGLSRDSERTAWNDLVIKCFKIG